MRNRLLVFFLLSTSLGHAAEPALWRVVVDDTAVRPRDANSPRLCRLQVFQVVDAKAELIVNRELTGFEANELRKLGDDVANAFVPPSFDEPPAASDDIQLVLRQEIGSRRREVWFPIRQGRVGAEKQVTAILAIADRYLRTEAKQSLPQRAK